MQEVRNDNPENTAITAMSDRAAETEEENEGLDRENPSWGDYSLDDLLIRHERRTIHKVIHRIKQSLYIMDPDFQRDFTWPEDKQSKLIESVIMRIPLPVFYVAENDEGRVVVVDGLQRLSTFRRFIADELKLKLPHREELDGQKFSELPPKIQNRIEGCELTFYIIDSKVPERARLDIFERVSGSAPLTRQQMRNSLLMGKGTRFLRCETKTDIFLQATGGSLKPKTMKDREFVNRFCAFQLLSLDEYRGDMDQFLADCLRQMNTMNDAQLASLSAKFRRGLANNLLLFDRFAFRKHKPGQMKRPVLNASFWDVMSTGLSRYEEHCVSALADPVRKAIYQLLEDEEFNTAITYGPNDARKVKTRFMMARKVLQETLGDHTD